MSTPIFVYDDARARRFEPFALTRPAGSLTAGMGPIWNRWQTALRCEVAGLVSSPHLDGFDDGFSRGIGSAPRMTSGTIPRGAIIASARFAPVIGVQALGGEDPSMSSSPAPAPGSSRRATRSSSSRAMPDSPRDARPESPVVVWRSGGRVAAVRTDRELDVDELRRGAPELDSLVADSRGTNVTEQSLEGWWMDEVWDLVRLLPEMLADDLGRFARGPGGRGWTPGYFGPPPAHAAVLGEHPVLVATSLAERGSPSFTAPVIEPHVVLDASNGPIVIMHGAHVHAFTRLNGPCLIGDGSTVMGGDLSTCSIGPVCKVRGEMSVTIMCGYANKGHDGFVGHSYLGRWTNLGAGTITSNLKNTYGPVALWTPDGMRDTGMQFLGTLFGDHAKTGIGTRLTTGTVLGAGANVYGSAMPPKCVPPFAWGERPPYTEYRLEKFLEVAERVMARRRFTLSEDCRRQLAAAWRARWTVDGGRGS